MDIQEMGRLLKNAYPYLDIRLFENHFRIKKDISEVDIMFSVDGMVGFVTVQEFNSDSYFTFLDEFEHFQWNEVDTAIRVLIVAKFIFAKSYEYIQNGSERR